MLGGRSTFERRSGEEKEDVTGSCPPHLWVIVDRREDGYREEQWECRRCGDTKFVRTPVWASKSGRMSNTSTWTPEDTIIGGEDEEGLLENEASA